jgi:tetratricopeptide (TPR) repeat protein
MELVEWSGEIETLPVPDRFIFAAAQGWFELGKLNESALEIKRLSDITQEDLDVLLFKTKLFCALGQFEQLKEVACKVLQAAPDDLDAWLNLAESIYRLDGAPSSIRCLKKLQQLLSENHRYCIALARYYAVMGDRENAHEWLSNSLVHGDALAEAERFPELSRILRNCVGAKVWQFRHVIELLKGSDG